MVRILSVPERIKLFKEINRVHKETYGWKMMYLNALGKMYFIDVDRDARATLNGWVPMSKSEATEYYFRDKKGEDITDLKGLFAWQAYYFHHANPYVFDNYYFPNGIGNRSEMEKLIDGDFISDGLGRRIRPDVSHPIRCLTTPIEVMQKDDGKIWISSPWLYHLDCYSAASPFEESICKAIDLAAGGDYELASKLMEKYKAIKESSRCRFERALKGRVKGRKMKHWNGGYAFAASREWRIKTAEQLNAALEVEYERFSNALEEFLGWLRGNGLHLGKEGDEFLKGKVAELYQRYPCEVARGLCELLEREDGGDPSDVYLWWGGEPNKDLCYAFLALYFEVDPNDIGTPSFDERVSRNLKAIVNVAEKDEVWFSSYREYEPHVWSAMFS